MLAEAVDEGIITRPAAGALAGKRDSVRRLQRYWSLTTLIFEMNLAVLSLEESRVRRAQAVRTSYGLLTTDSRLGAAAEENLIPNLVTLDSDFDTLRDWPFTNRQTFDSAMAVRAGRMRASRFL